MMSLTAMARMVEEDRGLIGTYTGLGYGRLAVASRYLLFALFACLIGGGLGLIAGFLGIPAFLLVVLRGLYVMPDVRLAYDWLYGTAGASRCSWSACLPQPCMRARRKCDRSRPVSCVRKRRVQDRAFYWSVSSRCGIA